jgi:hypothetical protein
MGFPCELVGTGNQNITRIIHINYAENMDLKDETNGLDANFSKKNRFFKKKRRH